MSLTPMKRIKGSMDNFKNIVSEYFVITQLEQRPERTISKYKTHNYEDKTVKAIQTDFKLIFKSDNFDIAFNFDYLNKDQEDHSIQISLTKNDLTKHSVFFGVSEFNSLLKNMNKKIKGFSEEDFDTQLFNYLNEDVIIQEFDFELELKKAKNEVTSFLMQKEEELNIPKYKNNANAANNKLKEAEDYIKQEIENTKEFKEFEKLKSRMSELQLFLNEKKDSLSKSVNLDQKKELSRISNSALAHTENELAKATETIKSKQKSVVRRKI